MGETQLGAIQRIYCFIGKWFEPLAIVFVCYVFAGSPTPSVNEAHYLTKAKHYWQPDWCRGDFFLESADAHEVFFWSFGWITQYLTLPNTAWVGRLLVWFLFALAWCRLLRALTDTRWSGLLATILLLPLTYYGHLAGEWLIGGIEAKGFAYPLVFYGIAQAIEGRWWQVWPVLGIASAFHILVGGWAVVACLFAWYLRREEEELDFKELGFWLIVGGVLALPGLIPAVQLTSTATAEEIREANITYTFRRLSHHLVPYRFAQWNPLAPGFTLMRPLCFGVACLAWWKLSHGVSNPRWQRLTLIVNGSLAIAFAGLVVEVVFSPFDHFQIPPFQGTRASLLRYYWFRMSDVMVPVGLATVAVARIRQSTTRAWQTAVALLLGTAGLLACATQYGCAARSMSMQQQSWDGILANTAVDRIDEDWLDVCDWFRAQAPHDVVVLTPVRQQTFKWFAHRPDVVTWKDVPQNASSIVQWWNRRRAVHKLGDWPWNEPEQLSLVLASYGVTHIAWPDQKSRPYGDEAKQVYRNELFRVFEIQRQSDLVPATLDPNTELIPDR